MQGQDGRVLVDNKGHSLYLFEKDESAESYCNGACAAVWPPYETESTPRAGGGLSASALGTIKRPDGTFR
jgi:predicted lipoprotein with Yx(FWY)xxD motif